MNINPRKAAIVGCGFVGASIAFRFLQQGLFSKLVLVDVNRAKAEGEAMDLSDGLPYGSAMEISAGDYDDLADCFLVVITAGANQNMRAPMRVISATASSTHIRANRRARSRRFSPRLCPTSVVAAAATP